MDAGDLSRAVGRRIIYLTPDALLFQPNALNRFSHMGDVSCRVPLGEVESVKDGFGVLTRIVTVALRDGTQFKFRCFGAAEFAQRIRDQLRVMGGPRKGHIQPA